MAIIRPLLTHRRHHHHRHLPKQRMLYQEFFQGCAISWYAALRCCHFMRNNALTLLGTTSDGSGRDVRRRGRPPTEVAVRADKGRWVRDRLCLALQRKKLTRPKGRVYGKRDRHNRVTE